MSSDPRVDERTFACVSRAKSLDFVFELTLLSQTRRTDFVVRLLTRCDHLAYVDMSWSTLDSNVLSALTKLPWLRQVSLRNVSGLMPLAFGVLSRDGASCRAESLDLEGCSGINDTSLASIAAGCPWLKKLSLRFQGRLTHQGLRALGEGCKRLCELDISFVGEDRFSSSVPADPEAPTGGDLIVESVAVTLAGSLRVLKMAGLGVTNHSVDALLKLKSLVVLDMAKACHNSTAAGARGIDADGFSRLAALDVTSLKFGPPGGTTKYSVDTVKAFILGSRYLEKLTLVNCLDTRVVSSSVEVMKELEALREPPAPALEVVLTTFNFM